MKGCKIDIQVQAPFRGAITKIWLRQVARRALAERTDNADCEMGLVIADDETVQALNRQYRGIDKITDVLSFALNEGIAHGFVSPPDGVNRLGEVIVSYPQAVRQAPEHGNTVEDEIALLITHGVLHLLGYDHNTLKAEAAMKAKEAGILAQLRTR